jgi:hypothetical protein
MEKNNMDTSSTLLFEVVFRDLPVLGENQGSPAGDRSIIVEVAPDGIVQAATDLPIGEAAREFAKELAPQFAMQVVRRTFLTALNPFIRWWKSINCHVISIIVLPNFREIGFAPGSFNKATLKVSLR